MKRPIIRPEIRHDSRYRGDETDVYEHPAFGVIQLSEPTGGDSALFGSDVQHNRCMTIRICQAELRRNLSNDWIHGREVLIEVDVSHAQFAEFVSSKGNGTGTPCTIRYAAPKDTRLEQVPGIAMPESKAEMFRREVEESAKERMLAIRREISRLGAMIEEGKIGKKDLREMHSNLARHAEQTSGSIGFVVNQAQEAIEKATTAAKIDVEAYIGQAARRIGMDAARNIGLIEGDAP